MYNLSGLISCSCRLVRVVSVCVQFGYWILTRGSHSLGKPGKFLKFYVKPGIFGIINWFTLVLTVTAVSCSKLICVTKEWMVNINDECVVFYIFRLRAMTKRTWNILKLDWKTSGFFSSKKVGTLWLIVLLVNSWGHSHIDLADVKPSCSGLETWWILHKMCSVHAILFVNRILIFYFTLFLECAVSKLISSFRFYSFTGRKEQYNGKLHREHDHIFVYSCSMLIFFQVA